MYFPNESFTEYRRFHWEIETNPERINLLVDNNQPHPNKKWEQNVSQHNVMVTS